MEATKERNVTPSSPSQIKPRLSVIDKIKSQLQHKEEDNLLSCRIFVDDPIKYSTPPKAENTTDVENDREANNTPPHEDTSVFHSMSERAFNEAEKMTMNQIWKKIINQTDNLATAMHGKQARDMLKSVQASEFTSMASGSFRGSKNGLVFNEEKNNELENMSAKFIFKKYAVFN